MQLENFTIQTIVEGLKKRSFSCTELVKAYFKRIKKNNDRLNAYLQVLEKSALESANASNQRYRNKEPLSPVDGVPIAIKDNICIRGVKTTASSNILRNFIPPYSATVINKLQKGGAIILGKTNLDAFAHGSSTENSDFGTTKNPWDLTRVPGGSSGGSASAVAGSMAPAALGSDTGGSIRQPAAFCGITGFKPTYGAVSRYGLIAMASSLDQIGPMTATAQDARILFDMIRGKDSLDATSFDLSAEKQFNARNMTIGLPKEFFSQAVDEDVKKVILNAIKLLKKNSARIKEISLPYSKHALAIYYIIQPTEVSSNLARYAGVNFGAPRDQFGSEAQRRIMLGAFASSAGWVDKYYQKAQTVKGLVIKEFDHAFQSVDLIMGPVAPTPAFKINEKTSNPLQMYLSDVLTVPVNPAGLPAISIPAGMVVRDGKSLPVGLQIIGAQKADFHVLNSAEYFQNITDFHKLYPTI